MGKTILASAMVAALALSVPHTVGAGEPDPHDRWKRAEELARKSLEELKRSLDEILQKVPIYGAPEVLPNGDIIIRRRPPAAPETAPEQPDITDTNA